MLSSDSVGWGGGGGGGASTVTRTLASAEPPGPLAVMVYVVESDGVTFVEPSGATAPTSGAIVSDVAFVEDQFSVAASPFLIEVGLACNVTVGRAGGGGGGVACFAHPTARTAVANAASMRVRYFGRETTLILVPP